LTTATHAKIATFESKNKLMLYSLSHLLASDDTWSWKGQADEDRKFDGRKRRGESDLNE